MKIYNFKIGNNSIFFPKTRIKTKKQILEILLETTRIILIEQPEPQDIKIKDLSVPIFRVVIDKMSRVFYFTEKKYYSISFPFTYVFDNNKAVINYKNIIDIDSKLISNILTILKDERCESHHSLDFIEPIDEIESEFNNELWFLIKELLMMEDGYVRFDNDIENYKKAKKEGKEHTHPENHLDFFYMSGNTLKIGLEKIITTDEFEDHFNTKTECKYLKSSS